MDNSCLAFIVFCSPDWPNTCLQDLWLVSFGFAMLGHVCQLHYHGGGTVAYHEDGKLTNIPFSAGPLLKVGQAVSFSIVDKAAVNVDTASGTLAELTSCTMSDDMLVERANSAMLSTSSRRGSGQSKRLQREIGRFRNATMEEQLDWVCQAEAELEQLLEDTCMF